MCKLFPTQHDKHKHLNECKNATKCTKYDKCVSDYKTIRNFTVHACFCDGQNGFKCPFCRRHFDTTKACSDHYNKHSKKYTC